MQNSPLPYNYVKEQINRANRFIYVFDGYKPEAKTIPVAKKFWSKHETAFEKLGQQQEEQHTRYMKMVEMDLLGVPKNRYDRPMVESHKYGWEIEPFLRYDDKDKKLFHHPKPRHEITLVGEKIQADKVTERPKYVGLPFKLR